MLKYFSHAFRKNRLGSTSGMLFLGVYFWSFSGMLLLDNELLPKNAKIISCYINIQENHGISETLRGFLRITSLCFKCDVVFAW